MKIISKILADPFALRASFGGVVDGLGNNEITGRWAAPNPALYPFMICLTFCLASDVLFVSLDVPALSAGSGREILRRTPIVAVVCQPYGWYWIHRIRYYLLPCSWVTVIHSRVLLLGYRWLMV